MKSINDPVVVVGTARTPIGSFGKSLARVDAHQLGAIAARGALADAGVDAEEVKEWIIGCVGAVGADTYISRRIAIAAGGPVTSTAMTVNRICGSGAQAVALGAQELLVGESDVVVAGGAENMSAQPFLDLDARKGYALGNRTLVDGTSILVTDPFTNEPMGVTAENVAERYDVSRQTQDAFAAESQRRAQAAVSSGAVTGEVVPVTITGKNGDTVVERDEHPRAGITTDTLATMRPVFRREGGTVTAGNSSGINDAACMLVLTRRSTAEQRGLRALAEFVDVTTVGIDPAVMGYAPKPAIERLLDRNHIRAADLDWIELNEAFAAQAVPVIRDLGLDPAKVNPLGGAIAWGHPIGATGAILTARTVRNIAPSQLGLVSLCIGGGQGIATLWRGL